jgi:hypothetical protein
MTQRLYPKMSLSHLAHRSKLPSVHYSELAIWHPHSRALTRCPSRSLGAQLDSPHCEVLVEYPLDHWELENSTVLWKT